jgi:hypothetical protein
LEDYFEEETMKAYDPWFEAGYTETEKSLWKAFNSQYSLSMELGVENA